jgi:hypothetical protein
MDTKIKDIFAPSTGVDLVFNMDSLNPVSRSSIIYDTDHKNQSITIAQPLIAISPKTAFDQLHLTTIIPGKRGKIRAGIPCLPVEFIQRYPLAGQAVTKALIIKYQAPLIETNIRSAFRLPLDQKFSIKAKLRYKQADYYTPKQLGIIDISFTGMGLLIPKIKRSAHHLSGLEKGEIIPLGMILVDSENEKPVGTFAIKGQVMRVNSNYSDSHILIGLKIIKMDQKGENLLSQFIHNAQIHGLQKLRVKDD